MANAGDQFGGEAEDSLDRLRVGTRIAGYLLEERIAKGGMAVVFRARDQRLGRQVALKILAPELASNEAFRRRFIMESRAAAAVDDPHIVPVFDAGRAGSTLYIAMRYVPDGDVHSLVRRLGPLPPARAAAIISSVASALDAAHAAGLVHRDIKPANMLVVLQPGRPDHVYVSDFGLSKAIMFSHGPTTTGQFMGTPDFTAPEQIRGKAVDGRADQYSLACAAFVLLTGAPPYPRDDVSAVIWAHMTDSPPSLTSRRATLPTALDGVVARALAKEPADRYATCREFADALQRAIDPESRQPAAALQFAALSNYEPGSHKPVRPVTPVLVDRPPIPRPANERHALPLRSMRRHPRSTVRTTAMLGGLLFALAALIVGLLQFLPSSGPAILVPTAFRGTWNGQVNEQGSTQAATAFSASLTLARGTSPGTITYYGARFSCTAQLTATAAQGSVLTVHQTAQNNQRRGATSGHAVCNNGTMVLSLSGTAPRSASSAPLSPSVVLVRRISMVYRYHGHPDATGVLTQVAPSAVAPAAFNGIWSGQVSSTGAVQTAFTVTVTFTTSKSIGSLRYTAPGGVNCSGTLFLNSASQRRMTMTIVTSQRGCSSGVPVTVTLAAPNSNSMNFSVAGSPSSLAEEGTLVRP